MFRIGKIIFSYDHDVLPQEGIGELGQLKSVEQTVQRGMPSRAIDALIEQQLQMPHAFHFDQMTLKDYGNSGLLWHIRWNLFPKEGGFSGVPFHFTSLVLPDGEVILPKRTLYDTYEPEPDIYICSTIDIDAIAPDSTISEAEIQEKATLALQQAIAESTAEGKRKRDSLKFRFVSQLRIQIPATVDDRERISDCDLWAVNFASHAREAGEDDEIDVFSVWVTPAGRVSDLKLVGLPTEDDR